MAQIPKIIEFLGRDPFEKKAETSRDRIREFRRIHGLIQKKLAEQLGVDETTIAGWEKSKHHPTKRTVDRISKLEYFELLT